MRTVFISLLAGALLTSCASIDPAQRSAQARQMAGQAGWRRLDLPAGLFTLTAFVPARATSPTLTIYLEGDGYAWRSPHIASDDPTPLTPLSLQLALKHPNQAAAYLARPCQFQLPTAASVCSSAFWTDLRYAPVVIDATSQAIDQLKARVGAHSLTLVGYSGGGAVAALVAARRTDVTRLVTLASNLDTAEWVRLQQLRPMAGSLNPADAWHSLLHVTQHHYAGAADAVVPPAVQQSFASRFPPGARPMVTVLPGVDHQCCWLTRWPALLELEKAGADLAVDHTSD